MWLMLVHIFLLSVFQGSTLLGQRMGTILFCECNKHNDILMVVVVIMHVCLSLKFVYIFFFGYSGSGKESCIGGKFYFFTIPCISIHLTESPKLFIFHYCIHCFRFEIWMYLFLPYAFWPVTSWIRLCCHCIGFGVFILLVYIYYSCRADWLWSWKHSLSFSCYVSGYLCSCMWFLTAGCGVG